MAVDTAAKRASVASYMRPGWTLGITLGSSVDQADRQAVCGFYTGILATSVVFYKYTVIPLLEKYLVESPDEKYKLSSKDYKYRVSKL